MSVSLKNISLKLSGKSILDNISVTFRPAELTILLGPNGAGKSSLLKMITREWACNGEIHYFDIPASDWKPEHIARHLGVLPQSSSLSFNFTVREVVELGAMTLKASQNQIRSIADKYMQASDISHLSDRLYPSLSGGEKQRVHLARILTQLEQSGNQKIVLLDEPTSALDLSHQHKTLQQAKSLTKEGASVVAVIHDLNLAAKYADRVMILDQGKLVADGSPWETLTEEKILEVYNWPVKVINHPEKDHPVILS
ncbi:heme ABC transporter ATP-binding protein [Vibrio sp. JC009]|uniref:heme ABC transporter ATP-binding protein n=1 Tax=Vibrio sp. JC009 TaxID=2912314 RepID=UPI0023B12450|nr:heme ABC transporter ATP-binding protein [Vibrio sp. JC009]WED22663.1 heme ABC transporter ATP-binding protein [Vibrio sp. JC009]